MVPEYFVHGRKWEKGGMGKRREERKKDIKVRMIVESDKIMV